MGGDVAAVKWPATGFDDNGHGGKQWVGVATNIHYSGSTTYGVQGAGSFALYREYMKDRI